jgi:hypothetical protein
MRSNAASAGVSRMLYRRNASNRSASFAGKEMVIVMGLEEVSVMGFESTGE